MRYEIKGDTLPVVVCYLEGGEGVFAGPASVQKGLESIQVHRLAGRQAVHHHADGRPVGLAEDADLQEMSELRGHECHLPIADIPPRKWDRTCPRPQRPEW